MTLGPSFTEIARGGPGIPAHPHEGTDIMGEATFLTLSVNHLLAGTIEGKEIIIAGGDEGVIRSDNYEAGVGGWRIDGEGDAEFNDVTIRGDVVSTNWDGVNPPTITTPADGVTEGYYLNSDEGVIQIAGGIYIPVLAINESQGDTVIGQITQEIIAGEGTNELHIRSVVNDFHITAADDLILSAGGIVSLPADDIIKAGGANDVSDVTLTSVLSDHASVVFTLPAGWTTARIVAWGSTGVSGIGAASARMVIGATNGTLFPSTASSVDNDPFSIGVHLNTNVTASSTIKIQVREDAGGMTHRHSWVQYIAWRID